MRTIIILALLAVCSPGAVAQRVFPEEELAKWGYKTTEVAEGRHAIRSLKNHGDEDLAFYARFNLSILTFESAGRAAAEKKRIECGPEPEQDKDYRRFVQKGRVLYVIRATSNSTRLGHQPALVKQVESYLEDDEAP